MAAPAPAKRDRASSDVEGRVEGQTWRRAHGAMQAGMLAGAVVGLADALLRLAAAHEFVAGAQLARFVGFVGFAYAAAGGWLALAGALTWRGLVLVAGPSNPTAAAIAAITSHHRHARDAALPAALWPLSATLVGLTAFALAGYLAFSFGTLALEGRKRHDLVVLIAMLGGGAVMALTMAAMVLLTARVASVLHAWLRRARAVHAIATSWWFALAVGLALITAALGWLLVRAPDTAAVMPLRAIAIAASLVSLTAAVAWRRRDGRPRALTTWVALIALSLIAPWLGNHAGVRTAAGYTGLGGPIANALGRALDLDRDGYAAWFGGGDCDDFDRDIHPGAQEVPDDGIDQNCLGGDLRLALATVPTVATQFAEAPRAPLPTDLNIIVITIDTLRADHVGAYGYARATTPHLDALAARGTRFANAWAHAPSTRYSIPAVLTGRLPLAVRYDTSAPGWPGLRPEALTLGELAQAAGRATGAILNYDYFDPRRRMDQGFAVYDNDNRRLHHGVPGQGPAQTRGSSSREQTDKAIEFVGAHAAKPFLLWVHYYDPHYAYEAHTEAPPWPGPQGLYDQEIFFTDLQIGRLLATLDALGLRERTAIVVTGDHGEGFGEHDIDFHGYHLYAAQTRVPFLLFVPGLPPRVEPRPIGHIDLAATVADLLDLRDPALLGQLMGQSALRPRAAASPSLVFQELSYENNNELRGVASANCHVIYTMSPRASWQVYETARDPNETRDLSARPAACATERAALAQFVDRSQVPEGAVEALLGAPPRQRRYSLWLGAHIELVDLQLPATAHRGDAIELAWTFAAHGTPPPGYKLFVHLEGPQGRRVVGDHEPARPFAWWQAGQFIGYKTTLVLPHDAPPGTYELWLGAWRGAHRLDIRDQARSAAGVPIVVSQRRAAVTRLELLP